MGGNTEPIMIMTLLLALACETTTENVDDSPQTQDDTQVQDTGEELVAEVHTITPDELNDWLTQDQDFVLLGVHVPYAGEIPGTDENVPYNKIDELTAAIGEDLNRTVVVYCKSGPMSAKAADDLVELGYTGIYDMPGGMNGWESAGYSLK